MQLVISHFACSYFKTQLVNPMPVPQHISSHHYLLQETTYNKSDNESIVS